MTDHDEAERRHLAVRRLREAARSARRAVEDIEAARGYWPAAMQPEVFVRIEASARYVEAQAGASANMLEGQETS